MRDQRALAPLEQISKRYPGRLEIVCADAQRFDPRPLLGDGKAKIVANLPYNIATALLIDWLSVEEIWVSSSERDGSSPMPSPGARVT